jgi:hypothetical protein
VLEPIPIRYGDHKPNGHTTLLLGDARGARIRYAVQYQQSAFLEENMPRYVIERQYLVPIFEHILVEAPSFDAACREALDDIAQPWGDEAQLCYDDARPTTVTYAVELPTGCQPNVQMGDINDSELLSSLLYCAGLEPLPIPSEFRELGEEGVGFV